MSSIDLVIEGRAREIGGFAVRRTLPSPLRRSVGPFVFFDHMGPADFAPGDGMDVRPHPHIALATVTYLFDGEVLHRDSIGSEQIIRPGDVNWMIAGRGIAHSERTPPGPRARGQRIHGIQSWVALPLEHEETSPSFAHHPAKSMPRVTLPGATLSVIAGTAYGKTSPVEVLSPTLYVHAHLDAGAELAVDEGHAERAVYVVSGSVRVDGGKVAAGSLVTLHSSTTVAVNADSPSQLMLVGGAPLDGPRHIWWNFVSSSQDRIERAKDEWRERRFAPIPGDDEERIPLPA